MAFTWSDETVQLLLSCQEYKASMEQEGTDWESVRLKYEEILTIVRRQNANEEINKERVAAKIKAVRKSFLVAVDAGRRSGGGRLVMVFYDLCQNLWGGSPSVIKISNAIETQKGVADEIEEESDNEDSEESGSSITVKRQLEDDGEEQLRTPVHQRRAKIQKFLSDSRSKKLSTKLSRAQLERKNGDEEILLKRKLVEHMERSDAAYNESLGKIAKTMESFSDSLATIARGMFQPYAHPSFPSTSQHDPYEQHQQQQHQQQRHQQQQQHQQQQVYENL